MKVKLTFLIVFAGLFMACSGEDDSYEDRLNGNWGMTTYIDYHYMPPPQLEGHEVSWSINGEKVIVRNSIENEFPEMISSGTYDAEVDDTAKTMLIIKENDTDLQYLFTYTVKDSQLTLTRDNGSANATVIIFGR